MTGTSARADRLYYNLFGETQHTGGDVSYLSLAGAALLY